MYRQSDMSTTSDITQLKMRLPLGLPEVVGNNHSILDILCALSEDGGNIRTDSLPMMDSIAWPIGSIDRNENLL